MDIQTLRSEIKAWERAYAEKHGRKPTPKEVKADPIGEYDERWVPILSLGND